MRNNLIITITAVLLIVCYDNNELHNSNVLIAVAEIINCKHIS